MTGIISVQRLTKRFGNFLAVDHISFDIEAGQVVGYLGPNGSGKTTTIRMLLGLLRPSEGSAQVLGYDAARQSDKVRAATGYMSQKFALYNDLTARENLNFYAGVYGVEDPTRVADLLADLKLVSVADQHVSTLSTGWRQRLALAAAIVHQPRLLLLDEPTSGVDPNARRAFWDLIYDLVATGITILVTTHYMDEAEYCSQVAILNNGVLLALDSPSNLKQSLAGKMWEIFQEGDEQEGTSALLRTLHVLESMPGVLRASLAGDHLRAWTIPDVSLEDLATDLAVPGREPVKIELTEPIMEDVFMALINRGNISTPVGV